MQDFDIDVLQESERMLNCPSPLEKQQQYIQDLKHLLTKAEYQVNRLKTLIKIFEELNLSQGQE